MRLEYPPGATPLDRDEIDELIAPATTQEQLNEYEAQNIATATAWAYNNPRLRSQLPTAGGLQLLHKRMFEDTWGWAGRFRTTNQNIGCPWQYIPERVQSLCGDLEYWIENSSWPWPELAVRFHHRLVSTHLFVNGNGRHARLAANLLLRFHGQADLPWAGGALTNSTDRRDDYISALRESDQGNLASLVAFANRQE